MSLGHGYTGGPLPLYMGALETAFWKFHNDNPVIYELFKKFTGQAIARGYINFGAQTVIERIRWETNVATTTQTGSDPLKICNDHAAYYARLWMHDHPMWPNFFRTRVLRDPVVDPRLK